jgi:hypothetical protein
MRALLQSEFPLRVAVCAWCKPKNLGTNLSSGSGSISHGICLRHLKKLRLELQMQVKKPGDHAASASRPTSRRRKEALNHPQLNYQT